MYASNRNLYVNDRVGSWPVYIQKSAIYIQAVICVHLTVKKVSINKITAPNYELDVNGTANANNLYALNEVRAPLITATNYFNMDVQYIRREYTVPGNNRSYYNLPCPQGYQILSGGGGHRDNNSAARDITINYSGPDPNNPSIAWRLMVTNTSGSSRAVVLFCNCAKIR